MNARSDLRGSRMGHFRVWLGGVKGEQAGISDWEDVAPGGEE
jgi:hypothetical protein